MACVRGLDELFARTGRLGLRGSFLAVIGGLLAYSYVSIELPGSVNWIDRNGFWGIVWITTLGALFGGLATLLWRWLKERSK